MTIAGVVAGGESPPLHLFCQNRGVMANVIGDE
jgi:hypothetical protein